MSSRLRFLALAALLLGSGAAFGQARPEPPPTPEQWRAAQLAAAAQADRIMRAAAARKGLLAQYMAMVDALYASDPADRAFQLVFTQYLGWYQSFVGDYPNAQASFVVQDVALPDDAPSPLSGPYEARPALEAIPALARGYRAVFLNEAHHVPLTRSLTVQLLARLRREGFDYFAVETLYADDTALAARGYPVEASGFYTREPVYAEMVRTALKLGFKVVAYESDTAGSGDARERAQAEHLYERVFRRDPQAKLVVNAGYAHIVEQGAYLGGLSMAQHFRRLTGIDPLTVEQTALIPHPLAAQDHPIYQAAMQRLHPDAPIVFVQPSGRAWSLRPGYDVSVFFPPAPLRAGRPAWLALGGLRKPFAVDSRTACLRTWPCLVEARYAAEGEDAVPADRLLFDPPPQPLPRRDRVRPLDGATTAALYLRPGRYRLRATDLRNHILSRQDIEIPAP
ncbi:hypothetical protein [Frateuria defendens]|uniref:hypothetical protein n=1 Tax=Frateuria defendens TaxID=2219559 RepID=UPI000B17C40D|nr:hypothetical protein [Frateuria defendens]